MIRGKPVKANYGDKGGVFIRGKSELSGGYEFDQYLDAVCIGILKIKKKEYVSVVFLERHGKAVRRGDIHHIPARQWHGINFLSSASEVY